MTTVSLPLAGDELKKHLQNEYVGKTLLEVPTPAAVLDLSIIRRNCSRMLEAVDALGFGWRAHIKTHKVLTTFGLEFAHYTLALVAFFPSISSTFC
jgi:hypothetical protein